MTPTDLSTSIDPGARLGAESIDPDGSQLWEDGGTARGILDEDDSVARSGGDSTNSNLGHAWRLAAARSAAVVAAVARQDRGEEAAGASGTASETARDEG